MNIVMNAYDELWRKQRSLTTGFTPEFKVSTEDAGDEALIRVRDNGDGIPSELRERIFEPFFSTKAADEGTGLGLSLAQEMAQNILGRADRTRHAAWGLHGVRHSSPKAACRGTQCLRPL